MYAFHLLETERKVIFYIYCRFCIMRQLHMIVKAVMIRIEPQRFMPAHALFLTVFVPLVFSSGPHKKLHFHLLEFTHAHDELPCYYLISESLACLRNTKRDLHPAGFLDI